MDSVNKAMKSFFNIGPDPHITHVPHETSEICNEDQHEQNSSLMAPKTPTMWTAGNTV